MNISYLIQMLQNKITMLTNAKSQAFSVGDIEQINKIDQELLDTQMTFSQLTMLADLTQAAALTNNTPAELVATGLDAMQKQTQGPSASAYINGYDISAYATDPLYEQKIQTIITAMPPVNVVGEIDPYILSLTSESYVTGEMILNAAKKYSTDIPLLIAIMQNDSLFGTLGVGARTNNPGNVGNTGSATQTFPSWQDGVNAVSEWLNRHRIGVPPVDPVEVVAPAEAPVVNTETTETPDDTEADPEDTDDADTPVEDPDPVVIPDPVVDTPVVDPVVPETPVDPVLETPDDTIDTTTPPASPISMAKAKKKRKFV